MGNVRVVLCALALIAAATQPARAETPKTSEECQRDGNYKIPGAEMRECGGVGDKSYYRTELGYIGVWFRRTEITTSGDPLPAFWKSEIEDRQPYGAKKPIVKSGGLWKQSYMGTVYVETAIAGVLRGTATTPPVIVWWIVSEVDVVKSPKRFTVTIPTTQLMTATELKKLVKPTMSLPLPTSAAPAVDDDPEPILKARYNFSTETPAFSDKDLPLQIKQDRFQMSLPADATSIGTTEWKATLRDTLMQIRVRASIGTTDVPTDKRSKALAMALVPSDDEQKKAPKFVNLNKELRGKVWFYLFKYEVPSPKGGSPAEVWVLRIGGFRNNRLNAWEVTCATPYGATMCVPLLTSFRITDPEASYEKTRAASLTGALATTPTTATTTATTTTAKTSTATPATTSSADVCPSLKTLVAAAPDKFAKLRGAKTEAGGLESYATTISVPGALKACSVTNGAGLWFASCDMEAKLDDAAAKDRLSALTAQVKACVPSWTVTNEASLGNTTTLSASKGGVSIKLKDSTWARKHDLSIMVLP